MQNRILQRPQRERERDVEEQWVKEERRSGQVQCLCIITEDDDVIHNNNNLQADTQDTATGVKTSA